MTKMVCLLSLMLILMTSSVVSGSLLHPSRQGLDSLPIIEAIPTLTSLSLGTKHDPALMNPLTKSATTAEVSSSQPIDHEDYEFLQSNSDYHTELIEQMERSRTSSPYLHELREKLQSEVVSSDSSLDSSLSVDDLMTRVEGPETAAEIRAKLEPYLHPKPSHQLQHEPPAPLVSQAKQRQLRTQHMKHVLEMKYAKLHHKSGVHSEAVLGKVTSVANHTVAKSSEDDRAYRFITLANGLRAVLVSDPNTTKSAAAMDVGNGYLSDPRDIPGLAHFLEHMLFLGTKKYPSESGYADFIESHGGFSNAYTAMENTNYYFDILPNHLEGALDRFAQFFISPLLNLNSTAREMKAVDSEHSKNILSDNWRANRLLQDIANRTHPYSKFGTGCAKTLDVMPHEEMQGHLRDFWNKHYTAGNLYLTIIGQESLDQLQAIVDEKFSPIVPSKSIYNPLAGTTYKDVFNATIMGSEVYVNTIEDSKWLSLIFPVESQYPLYKYQSLAYLRTLIEGRSANSLLKQLKNKGWATGVQLGVDAGTSAFATIQFSVDLTTAGAENIDLIIGAFFSNMNKIYYSGLDEWRYAEMQRISNLTFTYKDKEQPSDYISKVASNSRRYPPEDVLIGGKLFLQYNRQSIETLIDRMSPENMILVLGGKNLNHQMKFKEQWYGIEYDVVKIAKERIEYWKGARSNVASDFTFALPGPSTFLPKTLTVNPPLKNPVPRPIILYETPAKNVSVPVVDLGIKRLWYSEDLEFHRPHGHAVFRFYVPWIYSSARSYLLTNIFVSLLEDQIDEDLYSALLAGFSSHFRVGTTYLDLIFYGYNSGLITYATAIANVMNPTKGFRPDAKRFQVYKETLLQSYMNKKYEAPHRQSSQLLNSLLDSRSISNYDLVRVLETLTFEDVKAWPTVLYADMSLEAYVHGNVSPKDARTLLDLFTSALPYRTTSAAFTSVPTRNHYFTRPRLGQVKEDVAVTMLAANPQETNSAIVKYWQFGMGGIEGKLYSQLLALIAQKPIFHQLRTLEQLGYIVWSSADNRLDVNGFKIQVQSGRRPAHYLSERIDAFLLQFQQTLINMDQKQFETYIETLMMSKLQSPVSMAVQTSWFWNEISRQEYVFQRKEIELYILNATSIVNRAGFQAFVQKLFYISDVDAPGIESCELRGGGVLSVRIESPVPQVPIVNNSTTSAKAAVKAGLAVVKKHKEAKLSGGASIAPKKKAVATGPVQKLSAITTPQQRWRAAQKAKAEAALKQQSAATATTAFLEMEGDAEMEVEHETELEGEVEGEAEVESDVDSEADAEVDAEADSDLDADSEVDMEDDALAFLELDSELDAEHNPHGASASSTPHDHHDHHVAPQHADMHYDLPKPVHSEAHAADDSHGHAHGADYAQMHTSRRPPKSRRGAASLFASKNGAASKSVSVEALDQPIIVMTRGRDGNVYMLNASQSAIHTYTDSLMLYPRNRYEEPPPVTQWKNVKPKSRAQKRREAAAKKKAAPKTKVPAKAKKNVNNKKTKTQIITPKK